MRKILFKGKRKNWRELPKEKWWVKGYIIRDDITGQTFIHAYGNSVNESNRVGEEGCLRFFAYEVDPETLCQYTGVTDKNGNWVWENDIVSNKWCFARGNSIIKYGEYKDWHMSEEYKCGNLGFFVEAIDKREVMTCRKDMMYFAGNCEVIGNIFDSPELL